MEESPRTRRGYPFWTGEAFRNDKRRKKAAGEWPSEASYTQGALCPDGQWRKTITLDDAIAGGCDLFDVAQLELEYDEDKFQQLFYCKFIDSTQSAFGLTHGGPERADQPQGRAAAQP